MGAPPLPRASVVTVPGAIHGADDVPELADQHDRDAADQAAAAIAKARKP